MISLSGYMTKKPMQCRSGRRRGQSFHGTSSSGGTSHDRGKNSPPKKQSQFSSGLQDLKTYLSKEKTTTAFQATTSGSNELHNPVLFKDVVEIEPTYAEAQETEELLPMEFDDLSWSHDPAYLKHKYLSLPSFAMEESKPRIYYVSILQLT